MVWNGKSIRFILSLKFSFIYEIAMRKYGRLLSSYPVIDTLFVLLLVRNTISATCNQDGPCSCTFDDGSGKVDLSPIASSDPTNPL